MKTFLSSHSVVELFLALLFAISIPVAGATSAPLTISVQVVHGERIYRVDGKHVETSKANSLMTKLAEIVKARSTTIPVLIVVDVHAPFSEVGKLETALDKVEITRSRRLFVADFQAGTMNEIHWEEKAIPIPKSK